MVWEKINQFRTDYLLAIILLENSSYTQNLNYCCRSAGQIPIFNAPMTCILPVNWCVDVVPSKTQAFFLESKEKFLFQSWKKQAFSLSKKIMSGSFFGETSCYSRGHLTSKEPLMQKIKWQIKVKSWDSAMLYCILAELQKTRKFNSSAPENRPQKKNKKGSSSNYHHFQVQKC